MSLEGRSVAIADLLVRASNIMEDVHGLVTDRERVSTIEEMREVANELHPEDPADHGPG